LSAVTTRPVFCFALLITTTALAYLPPASAIGPLHWTVFGPFAFQTSRLLHYAVYFFGGIVIGARGLEQGLLASGGRLAQRWPLWTAGALLAYAFAVGAAVAAFAEDASAATLAIAHLGFVVSCAASCFALLALFLRFVRTSRPVLDSLRGNSYGMYVVHYTFASWLPYALLRVPLPALGKATAAVLATVVLSWAATVALRQVPAIRRVL
jgi:surface polysaccharide O-acyltransferase-like enzyme